ncbi:MAG: tetratricopeptide repeat protein [Terriglobia bacterium]
MKRLITILGICLLLGLVPLGAFGQATSAAKKPQWKSREEYDAYQAMLKGTTPQQKIQLADAFLQKYPTSDFGFAADLVKLQEYQALGETTQAVGAARASLKANSNNLGALNYLSFVFPYTFKPNSPNAATELAQAASDAKQGLQMLQQEQKPAGASQEAFDNAVKQDRSNFNRALGFAALQQKDYANAITYLKATIQDSPDDSYAYSFLGQAYLYTKPADYNSALWYLARGEALARKSNTPNLAGLTKLYDQWYEFRHGSNAGENDVVTEAASGPTPPAGFNVAPPPTHAKTPNPNVNAFYGIEDSLSVGGDAAQTAWTGYKGQPLGILVYVESVQPGTDPGSYVVRADVLPQDRGKAGMYNLLLQTSQEDAQYLKLGTPITFKGTLSAYTVTPSFVLTLSNAQLDQGVLTQAAEEAKAAKTAKPAPRRRRR